MDAIEYSVKLASQIAVNGQIKEAYDLYLANLGKLIVRLKTVVDIAEDGSSKNADEALFRMIPLCRVCVNKIEDILQAGAISSAFLSRGPHGVPPPLSKSPGRLTSSFLGTVMPSSSSHSLSAASHDTSLFSAVLDGFPVDDFNPPPHLGNEVSKGDSFVSYEAPESQSESTRSSVDDSMLDSLKERVENHTQRFKTLEPESSDGHFTMEPSTSKATKAPPEIPSSPLNTLYMTLSQKLIMRINSPTSPNQYSEPQQSVDAEEEESNQIRTQIGRILNQIQIASVSNAGINMFCFRPIAIAYQLCVIEHTLFRNIHSNDILIHKPPHSPAPSFQGISDFFNYLTRLIECTILQQVGVTERVKTILKWIKVAVNLKRFNNFQTLKGVTSALSTPPIIRLKKTWTMLRRKYTNESADLEELTSLVSEQSNFNKYRSFIKDNQTRPMVPFLGVLLHDVTYLTAAGKKEGASDISSDKRIQEILKFIRYCSLGPRYSYEMLIEMDTMHSSSSFVAPSKKSPLTVKRKVKGGGLSEYGMEALGSIFKDSNEEEIGIFMSHWLLSRKWVSEREVDDLSKEREPKASNTVAAAPKHHATVLVGNASEASTEDPENNSLTRQSKTDDNDACQIRNVSGSEHSTLRAGKDSVANSQSPSLSRSRATQASNSFISVIESAFMKGSKPQGAASAASGTGASTPSNAALNSSGKRVAAGGATSSKEFRGRPLNRLLNRRQKSLSNLNTDEFPSSSKSVSMDAVNTTRSSSIAPELSSFGPIAEKVGGSYDSMTGSICATSNPTGLVDETPSSVGETFMGVASEELKKKLEVLVKNQSVLAQGDVKAVNHTRSSSTATPAARDPSGTTSSHRHNFFSFFTYSTSESSAETSPMRGGDVGGKGGGEDSDGESESHSLHRQSKDGSMGNSATRHSITDRSQTAGGDAGTDGFLEVAQRALHAPIQDSDSSNSSICSIGSTTKEQRASQIRRRASSTSMADKKGVTRLSGGRDRSNSMAPSPLSDTLKQLAIDVMSTNNSFERSPERSQTITPRTLAHQTTVKAPNSHVTITGKQRQNSDVVTHDRDARENDKNESGSFSPLSHPMAVLGWGKHLSAVKSANVASADSNAHSNCVVDVAGPNKSSKMTSVNTEILKVVLPTLPKASSVKSPMSPPPMIPPKPVQLVRTKLGSTNSLSSDHEK